MGSGMDSPFIEDFDSGLCFASRASCAITGKLITGAAIKAAEMRSRLVCRTRQTPLQVST